MFKQAASAVVAGVLVGFAHAGSITLDGIGGAVSMQSKDLRPMGIFGSGSPDLTNQAVRDITEDLQSDGITMDRLITFILADTDDGLSFIAILDDITQTGDDPLMTQVSMTTTGPITANGYINDANEDLENSFNHGNGTQSYSGHFTWNAARSADAFAWSQMQQGDFFSFNFARGGPDYPTFPGIQPNRSFQFVSWNGSNWEVVSRGRFSTTEQFAFSFTIIPLPAPLLMGLAGLLGVAALRRRRAMKN